MNVSSINTINWQISTSSPDTVVEGVDDVRQCIDVILKTRKGEDPLRPHFGCGLFDWIDKPNTTAIPNMKKEILQAIKAYETRIIVTGVQHEVVPGGVKFVINYDTLGGHSYTTFFEVQHQQTSKKTLVLQATYSEASRYFISLELDGSPAVPAPPAAGFASISDVMQWVNNNWYMLGAWYWIFGQKKIVAHIPAAVAGSGSLNVVSSANTLTATIPALTNPAGYYLISFANPAGQLVQPVSGSGVVNAGDILDFVQANYGNYGNWAIDGDTLVLTGSGDITGYTLEVSEQVYVQPAFTTAFNLGFQA